MANVKFLPLSLTMQVFVKSLAGNTLALDVTANSSVESVKAMIQTREGECPASSGKRQDV